MGLIACDLSTRLYLLWQVNFLMYLTDHQRQCVLRARPCVPCLMCDPQQRHGMRCCVLSALAPGRNTLMDAPEAGQS